MIPPVVQPGNVFQRVRMPNSAGANGEALRVTSVSGDLAQLEWTAGYVTNLTGPVTSVGNATAIADSALAIAKTSGLQTELDAKGLATAFINLDAAQYAFSPNWGYAGTDNVTTVVRNSHTATFSLIAPGGYTWSSGVTYVLLPAGASMTFVKRPAGVSTVMEIIGDAVPQIVEYEPETVAELLTLSGLTDGKLVSLAGYYAKNDGGGQDLIYRATGRVANSITDNKTLDFFGTGADNYFAAVERYTIFSKRAGCKGDGTTDDRARLAAADAIGPVTLQSGTYLVSSNLTLTNTVTFATGAKLKPASNLVTTTLSGGYTARDTQQVFDVSAGGIIAATMPSATPQNFGVTPGVDCTASFQAAIDMLNDTDGGHLILLPLEHTISGTVTLRERVSIVASDAKHGVKIAHNPSATADLFVANYAPSGQYNRLASISNLTLTGNANSRYALDLSKSSFLTIEKLFVTGFARLQTACIRLRESLHTTINECFLQPAGGSGGVSIDFGQAVSWIGTTVSVNQCYMQLGNNCLTFYPGSWYHVVFNNCIFESTTKGIADIGAGNPSIVFNDCYSENIGTDGDGTSMFRVGVTAAGLDKSAWVNLAAIKINGGTYSGSYTGAASRKFVEADATRAVIGRDTVVAECKAGLLSTTVYTMDVNYRNVTTPQVEDENFGSIYDWSKVSVTHSGYDAFPKGIRPSVATQILSTGTGTVAETTLNLPQHVRITGVSFYVKSPGITAGTWSAELIGGVNLPLVSGITGVSNTPAGVTVLPGKECVATGAVNVRLKCDSGVFTNAGVQIAVSYEVMHFQTSVVSAIADERLTNYWNPLTPTAPKFVRDTKGLAYSSMIVPTLKAGDFDGTGDYLTIAKAAITGTTWTYAWYCAIDVIDRLLAGNTADSGSYLAYFGTTTTFYHKPNASVANNVAVTVANPMTTASLIVLRRDGNGNNFSAWQDGVAATMGYTGTVPDNPSQFDLIGKGVSGLFYDGKLWLLRAWNRALTSSEVAGLSSGVVPKKDLVLDLQFADGRGTTVSDFSGKEKHASGAGTTGSGFWVIRPGSTEPATILGSFTKAQLDTAISDGNGAYAGDSLAVFGSTTSVQLAGVISDETGTGLLVFATNPVLTTPNLGTPSALVVTNATGTASININGTVGATTPAAGTFTDTTASSVSVSGIGGAQTVVILTDPGGTLDNKHWHWSAGVGAGNGVIRLRAVNDAITNGLNAIVHTRTGIASIATSIPGALDVGGALTATGPTFVAPLLGTPASGVATNLTGTAAGLTAGNVTTNANLTGGVTSVGNAATVITNANLTGQVTSIGNAASLGAFTKTQLDTAISDGNAVYVGDAVSVPDDAYGTGWDGSLQVPTKNAVYDRLEVVSPLSPSVNNRAINNKILYGVTTDAATSVELTTDGAAGSGATNRIAVQADTALSVVLNISVKQAASANAKQMLRQFVISNNAGTTAIQGTVVTLGTDSGSAGLTTVACTVTANDTNDCIKIEVTGVAATNLRYTAYLVSTEVLYA